MGLLCCSGNPPLNTSYLYIQTKFHWRRKPRPDDGGHYRRMTRTKGPYSGRPVDSGNPETGTFCKDARVIQSRQMHVPWRGASPVLFFCVIACSSITCMSIQGAAREAVTPSGGVQWCWADYHHRRTFIHCAVFGTYGVVAVDRHQKAALRALAKIYGGNVVEPAADEPATAEAKP